LSRDRDCFDFGYFEEERKRGGCGFGYGIVYFYCRIGVGHVGVRSALKVVDISLVVVVFVFWYENHEGV